MSMPPPTTSELTRRVRGLLSVALGLPEAQLTGDVSQAQYPEWTSLSHLGLMLALEEEFDVSLTGSEMTAMTSISRIVETLHQRAQGASAVDGDLATRLAAFVSLNAPQTLTAARPRPVQYPVAAGADRPAEPVAPPEELEMPGPHVSAAPTATVPRGLREYVTSPRSTWVKGREWLNARWQLRACNRVGRLVRVTGQITVNNFGVMTVGDRVRIYAHHARSVFTTFTGGRLTIGDGTVINYGVDIAATGSIKIGANCMIGTHVSILDNDFHELEQRDKVPQPRPVVIGDNCWIGNRAIVMPGITIGEGAAVGAGSVVIADVPPRSLAMGNPARIVKHF